MASPAGPGHCTDTRRSVQRQPENASGVQAGWTHLRGLGEQLSGRAVRERVVRRLRLGRIARCVQRGHGRRVAWCWHAGSRTTAEHETTAATAGTEQSGQAAALFGIFVCGISRVPRSSATMRKTAAVQRAWWAAARPAIRAVDGNGSLLLGNAASGLLYWFPQAGRPTLAGSI
eukprot:COSAG06_NODE_4784_length_3957_cov_4.801970_3_plen_174_part_00